MRKYLMTGMAALAISAAFTSCSKDTDVYNSGVIENNDKQSIINNYNEAFIATFGQPAANQDWGFGSVAKTREANVNGNQWHDGVNYNYEYDAKVTTDEMNKVFNYVNDKDNVVTVDQISFQEYWVSQIWNGKDDANANGVKAPTSTSYRDQNGATTEIVGGGQMDQLMIKETADGGWIHCNNFNAADNDNYKEGGEGGRTLMTSSGTYSFGYTNSQGSFFSTKYIIVPGAQIDESLKDFYYVCFDFERHYVDGEEEKTTGSYEAWNGNNYQGGWNFSLDGHLNEDEVKAAIGQVNGRDIQNIDIKGYLYGDKHCDGDDNYTDWIVRISPAKVKSNYDIRIIGEDLNATKQAGDTEDSDWDFNDVVIDVDFTGANKCTVRIAAAGGTLPLIVGVEEPVDGQSYDDNEIHHLLGQPVGTMVNTNAHLKGLPSATVAEADLPTIDLEITGVEAQHGKNIPIYVEKVVNGDKKWFELTATKGQPAAKIGVTPSFRIVNERNRIDSQDWYPLFSEWVEKVNVVWY